MDLVIWYVSCLCVSCQDEPLPWPQCPWATDWHRPPQDPQHVRAAEPRITSENCTLSLISSKGEISLRPPTIIFQFNSITTITKVANTGLDTLRSETKTLRRWITEPMNTDVSVLTKEDPVAEVRGMSGQLVQKLKLHLRDFNREFLQFNTPECNRECRAFLWVRELVSMLFCSPGIQYLTSWRGRFCLGSHPITIN